MAKYRVHAASDDGLSGESPTFYADSPEEAEAEYLTWKSPMNVYDVELVEE